MENEEFIKAYRKLYEASEEFRNDCRFIDDIDDDDAFSDEIYEATEEIGSFIGLEAEACYESGVVYIGLSPFQMGDDVTLKEYKQKICDSLEKIGFFTKPNQLEAIDEQSYN